MPTRHLTRLFGLVAVAALAASACTSSTATQLPAPTTAATTEPTAAATPTPAGPQLTVIYEENCQVELISQSGQRILIDVWNPASLSTPATASDILLTTHTHGDHYVQSFEESFPGKKLTNANGDLTVGDIKVKSLAASHDENAVDASQPTNHIFVIDIDGFHIAHLGSTGQDQLTADQLSAIGTPDIAFAVLIDLGATSLDDTRPLRIIESMKPRLVIPTHTKLDSVKLVSGKWPGFYAEKTSVKLAKGQLPTATTVLFMGQLATSYGAILDVPKSSW